MYRYTLLNQDGTQQDLGIFKKGKNINELYEILNCETVELIPQAYYDYQGWKDCTIYGDEEGRYNDDNHANPFFKTFPPPQESEGVIVVGSDWNVVGNCLLEEVV